MIFQIFGSKFQPGKGPYTKPESNLKEKPFQTRILGYLGMFLIPFGVIILNLEKNHPLATRCKNLSLKHGFFSVLAAVNHVQIKSLGFSPSFPRVSHFPVSLLQGAPQDLGSIGLWEGIPRCLRWDPVSPIRKGPCMSLLVVPRNHSKSTLITSQLSQTW